MYASQKAHAWGGSLPAGGASISAGITSVIAARVEPGYRKRHGADVFDGRSRISPFAAGPRARHVSRRFRVVALLALMACSITSYADASSTRDLRQLIELAQRHNKDVQVAEHEVGIEQGRFIQAGLLPNPRLEVSARSDFLFRSEGEYAWSLALSQRFPIAGRLERERQVASVDVSVAQIQVRQARWRLAGQVASAVYKLLLIDRQIALRDDIIAIQDKLAKVTRDRYKAAQVSELDVDTTRLDLARLAQERSLLQGEREAAVAALNTLLGQPVDTALSIDEPLPESASIPSLVHLQAQALTSRPDYRAALLGADRASAQTALAQANRWEDWNAGLVLEQDKLFIDGGAPQRSDRAIGFTLTIPLPLFNRNQGPIATARASGEQADARIDALRLQIAGEVAGAYAQVTKLKPLLVKFHEHLLALSAHNVALAQRGYSQGLLSIVEVVQAQRQQASLNAGYLNTLDAYLQALVRLRNADGYYVSPSASDTSTKGY